MFSAVWKVSSQDPFCSFTARDSVIVFSPLLMTSAGEFQEWVLQVRTDGDQFWWLKDAPFTSRPSFHVENNLPPMHSGASTGRSSWGDVVERDSASVADLPGYVLLY